MTRRINLRGPMGLQKLLLVVGTTLFLGGLLVVAGIGGPGVSDLGSDPATTETHSSVDTDTPNQRQTATPSERGDTPTETKPPSTAAQAKSLNGATEVKLTNETIRTGVSVSGPLSENLHITRRTVIKGQLGLTEVVADVKIEDNARITGHVAAASIGDEAGVSLTDGAQVGGISVGAVTDGNLKVKDHTTVDGGITIAAVHPDGNVKLDDSTTVGDDVSIGQVHGGVELAGDTVVDGNLLINRIGSEGEVTLEEDVKVRGDVIIREVAEEDQIDINENAVAGDIIIIDD